jgi:hypothetical protein
LWQRLRGGKNETGRLRGTCPPRRGGKELGQRLLLHIRAFRTGAGRASADGRREDYPAAVIDGQGSPWEKTWPAFTCDGSEQPPPLSIWPCSRTGEVERLFAAMVFGGLITYTLLTILVLPVPYTWIESHHHEFPSSTGTQ